MEFEIKDHSDAQDLLFLFASRLRAALTYRRDRVGLDGYTSALFLYRLMRETVSEEMSYQIDNTLTYLQKITSRIIAICHLRSWPVTIPSIITDAFLMFYVAQSSNTAGDASLLNLETTEDDKSRILETYYDQWWSASTDEKKWSNDGNTWSMDAALKVYRQQVNGTCYAYG